MKRLNIETLFSLGYKSEYPQRQLLMGYSVYSILGALILSLPFCCRDGISIVDNLFSAVSALSTTGLSSVDVSSDYTFWGQLVILLLIQLGGLEIMGVLLLYPYFLLHDVDNPLWSALFHSVSAFCTAGFSIFSDNLMQFQTDWYVNFVVAILSYMGAMGFIMMTDVLRKLRHHDYRISFTTKVIAVITTGLTIWSTLHLFFEPTLQGLPTTDRLLASWFHSMSAITTVGFNTIDTSTVCAVTMIILSFSMYIGASPSGTGGGLKSTTLSALYAYTKNKLGLRKDISLAGNKVPTYRVDAALTTAVFYTLILAVGIYLLTLFEGDRQCFLDIVFEATSALATAGLSSGILSTIGIGSKLVLIVLMFIGRVGVITLGNVMLVRASAESAKRRSDLVD